MTEDELPPEDRDASSAPKPSSSGDDTTAPSAASSPADSLLRAVARSPAIPIEHSGLDRRPGDVLADRYRLERRIGEGGMGVVWAARHVVTRKPVALKLIRSLAQKQDARHRFVREARAACAVRHPNVVQVHDVLELPDGSPVMVMDLLAGESLGARLRRRGKLALSEVARIMLPVVSAVGTAHAMGIVHRDLKPDNVFLAIAPDGSTDVKVLDFGVAKLTAIDGDAAQTAGLTATGALLGTPYYMAPEQAFGERDVDHRADVWAIGVMLYECLSGVLPTRGDNVGQVLKIVTTGTIRPLAHVEPDLPREVTSLVDRMLARDRDARPRDLVEVRAVLSAFADVRVESFGGAALAQASTYPSLPLDATTRSVALSSGASDGKRAKRVAIVASLVALGGIAASAATGWPWRRASTNAPDATASSAGAMPQRGGLQPDGGLGAVCRSAADCVSGRCYQDQCRPWSEYWGHDQLDTTTSVAILPDGDVLAAGYFYGPLEVGCGPMTSAGSPQMPDGIVTRFSRTGQCVWQKRLGAELKDVTTTVLATPEGHAVASGTFNGEVDFGGGALSVSRESSYVVQLDGAGRHVWSKAYDGVFIGFIARDHEGNLVAHGGFSPASVKLGKLNLVNATPPYMEAFVMKLSATGELMWAKAFRGPSKAGDDLGHWVAVDAHGDVAVTGAFYDRVDLGAGWIESAGAADTYLAKLSGKDGSVLWAKRFGTAADEPHEGAVAFDDEGNVVVAGEHRGADRGGGALPGTIYAAKYSPSGEHVWSRGFGGSSPRDCARRVAVDAAGDVIFFGRYFSPTMTLDDMQLNNAGGADVFVVRLNGAKGSVAGVRSFFANGAPARAMALHRPTGNIVVGGRFEGTIDFGGKKPHVAIAEDGYFASIGRAP